MCVLCALSFSCRSRCNLTLACHTHIRYKCFDNTQPCSNYPPQSPTSPPSFRPLCHGQTEPHNCVSVDAQHYSMHTKRSAQTCLMFALAAFATDQNYVAHNTTISYRQTINSYLQRPPPKVHAELQTPALLPSPHTASRHAW